MRPAWGRRNYSGHEGARSAALGLDGRLVPAVALSPYRLPRHFDAGAKALLRQTQPIGRDRNCVRLAIDSDLPSNRSFELRGHGVVLPAARKLVRTISIESDAPCRQDVIDEPLTLLLPNGRAQHHTRRRSEEHTSELQSHSFISYA